MKKNIFYSFIILLFFSTLSQSLFSQSQSEKNRAINDYFQTIYKDTTQVIFISREKINSNETLKIFGLNDIMIIDADGNGKGDNSLYNKKDFEIMKTKYENKCLQGKRVWCRDDFWTKDNFKFKKVVIESMNTDKGIELIFEKYNNFDIKVYGFSDPIYYQNNEYVVFTANASGLNSYETHVVIMKKKKCNWIVTPKASTNVYN
jgi:hypothetical protein